MKKTRNAIISALRISIESNMNHICMYTQKLLQQDGRHLFKITYNNFAEYVLLRRREVILNSGPLISPFVIRSMENSFSYRPYIR